MSAPDFDFDEVFAPDDYLYFYDERLSAERTDGELVLIWRLLGLEPGMAVLDLACGHGRISQRLARRGCQVVGLDSSPGFLELARRDAAALAWPEVVAPEYILGDMGHLPWSERFDRILNWFTAFGYFNDEGNRQVLREAQRALKPGGKLLVELNNRDALEPPTACVGRRAQRQLHDRSDALRRADRAHDHRAHRHPRREGAPDALLRPHVHLPRTARLAACGRLLVRGGLRRAGAPLALESRRMLVVATK